MLIYLATNKTNGKKYVGYTTLTLEERVKTHVRKSKSKTHYFYLFKNALRKYGPESFSWEVLEYCASVEECWDKEKYYIEKINTISPLGYNLTYGGNGGIQCDETKLKISTSLKKYYSENKHPLLNQTKLERQERVRKAWITKKEKGFKTSKGYTQSAESCKKMSESKNKKNALSWINVKTQEEKMLSCTEMSRYTGLSISTFNHIKMGRATCTKTGWQLKRLVSY